MKDEKEALKKEKEALKEEKEAFRKKEEALKEKEEALKEKDEKQFIIEKIKERPLNKKRLVRRTLVTATMAVIFGLIACFTFLLLEPVISDWLYPKEEQPEVPPILFPEDQEEMSPEEMLMDAMHAEMQQQEAQIQQEEQGENPEGEDQQEEAEGEEEDSLELTQEQIDKILEGVVLDQVNYRELYVAMSYYVEELKKSVVTVTGIRSDVDWLNNEVESTYQSSGVIIANAEQKLYILTDFAPIADGERITVTFSNQMVAVAASVLQVDPETELALVVVDLPENSEQLLEEIAVATLGNSSFRSIVGIPVVALGSPMGVSNSVSYGMISAPSASLSLIDAGYKILYTDIYGSKNAGGILFNMQNEVIGIITNDHSSSDSQNLIKAYGISELKKLITKMTNSGGAQIPHLGIRGADISRSVSENLQIPQGTYVVELEKNSPAMEAGIQQGDIVVALNGQTVINYNGYTIALMNLEPGQEVEISVMRQSQEEYREMNFTVTVGGVGLIAEEGN